LQTNLAGVTGATAHRLALGGRSGSGSMVRRGTRSLDHQLADSAPSTDGDVPVIPLAGVIDLTAAPRVAFLKLDIEGAERDLFDTASPAVLRCFDRIALEYHDHFRPGTLALLEERLSSTHRVAVYPSALAGCGVLRAWRR
jgi:FkbM family methyltransferase